MGKEDACACVCSAFALHNETVRTHAHTHTPRTRTHAHTTRTRTDHSSLSSRRDFRPQQVNIWTHGLAFLMFAGLVLENLLSTANMPFYDRYHRTHTTAHTAAHTRMQTGAELCVWCVCVRCARRAVFLVYLGCVSTCFCISTFYHVFRNHSVRAYANWLIADINGVGTIPSALVPACVCVCVCVCVCRSWTLG